MGKRFTEYSQFDLSQVNKDVLKKWDENQVFAKSMTERDGCPSFVFFEGPPSANGMPGIHHVMARTIKDIFCRYKTMKGYQVKRKAGWDTHGLPVELGVEKALGITKEDIGKKISVAEYNAACRKDVMKFTKEWEDLTHKMGYWVDMKHPYITYDNRYIETLWWLLKQLYKKGLLYKGYTIQPYSPAAGTGLSSHELNQPGCYRDVKDTTMVAQFKIKNPKPEMTGWGTPYFLAWTTTPWTLPSNTALCVGPKFDYVVVQSYNTYNGEPITVVLAKALLNTHFNPKAADLNLEDYKPGDKLVPFKVVAEYKGTELVGMEYEQLIPWVKPIEVSEDGMWKVSDKGFRVIQGDYVTTEDGTGIVHIAPTFGADDANVARAAGIPSLFMINKKGETRPMVDLTGKFYLLDELDERFVKECVDVDEYKEYQGAWVKNAYDPQFTVDGKYDEKAAQAAESLDIALCMMMKAGKQAFKIEKHVHNYPHCWRTDKPVLYYPLDSWFIRSTACKERMMELNKTINWKPESTGTGRFGKWLENLNDWNLSRSRYWGTPLPIWRTEDNTDEKCIESVEELYNEIEKSVAAGFMQSNRKDNIGEVMNKGVEIQLRSNILNAKDWFVAVFANMAHNENKITKISDSLKEYNKRVQEKYAKYDSGKGDSKYSETYLQYVEGGSLTSIFGVRSLGINPADGKEIYLRPDGTITYDWNAADQVVIGNEEPKLQGTFGFNLRWKQFSLYSTFMYEFGGQRYNSTLVSKVENVHIQSSNVDRRVLTGRWQKPGDCTPYGRLQTDGVVAVTRPTSRFIQDYNVLTFNSLTLGYDFNAEWLKKARIGLLRVELSGNDLFRVATVRAERGLDYPYSRSFAASVKMSF